MSNLLWTIRELNLRYLRAKGPYYWPLWASHYQLITHAPALTQYTHVKLGNVHIRSNWSLKIEFSSKIPAKNQPNASSIATYFKKRFSLILLNTSKGYSLISIRWERFYNSHRKKKIIWFLCVILSDNRSTKLVMVLYCFLLEKDLTIVCHIKCTFLLNIS